MEGWFFVRGLHTAKFASKSKEDPNVWPPKFWKFAVETEEEPKVEAAFADSRRFARIRLLDCAAGDIRQTTPLKENGPDPVIDRELFTLDWFSKKMLSKKVPVKALLLDQANISGIGNWVGYDSVSAFTFVVRHLTSDFQRRDTISCEITSGAVQ